MSYPAGNVYPPPPPPRHNAYERAHAANQSGDATASVTITTDRVTMLEALGFGHNNHYNAYTTTAYLVVDGVTVGSASAATTWFNASFKYYKENAPPGSHSASARCYTSETSYSTVASVGLGAVGA